MTYVPEAQIEFRAAELWRRYGLQVGFDVEVLLDDLDLGLLWEQVDDEDGANVLGQLDPDERLVVLNERHRAALEEKDGRLRRYTIGHEVGHWELHAEAARSGTLKLFDGKRIWCRDGSRDPVERQAEMFSAALLIPRDKLLASLPRSPWRGWRLVYDLADDFAVNPTPMLYRLEKLGWAHRDQSGVPTSGPAPAAGQGSLFTS